MNASAWSRGFIEDESNWYDGRVPMFARAGAAWSDTQWSFPYTVSADLAYRDEDGTISVPVGLEVKALPYISLRIGKRIGWENEVVSLGIGFNIDKLSFDAAFVPTVFVSDYEMKWSMGFTYNMGVRKKAAPVKKEIAPIEEESVPSEENSESEEDQDVIEEEVASPDESVSTGEKSVLTEESVPAGESTSTDGAAPTKESTPAKDSVPAE
jgi:hypothetical protein